MASFKRDFRASSDRPPSFEQAEPRDLSDYDLQPCRDGPLIPPAWSAGDHRMLADLLGSFLGPAASDTTAQAVLSEFGGIGGVLAAPKERLDALFGDDDPMVVEFFLRLRRVVVRSMRQRLQDRPVLSSWSRLTSYLRTLLAYETREQVRTLYLDTHHRLIVDDLTGIGTINHAPAYPREIVRRGLDVGAKSLVLVHNHPSGDPTPSSADIATTRKIAASASVFEMELLDHLVVGKTEVRSMKQLGLLPQGPLSVDYEPRGYGKAVVRTRASLDGKGDAQAPGPHVRARASGASRDGSPAPH